MSNLSLHQILSDTDFRQSDFFPINYPLFGDTEFREYITQMYDLQ